MKFSVWKIFWFVSRIDSNRNECDKSVFWRSLAALKLETSKLVAYGLLVAVVLSSLGCRAKTETAAIFSSGLDGLGISKAKTPLSSPQVVAEPRTSSLDADHSVSPSVTQVSYQEDASRPVLEASKTELEKTVDDQLKVDSATSTIETVPSQSSGSADAASDSAGTVIEPVDAVAVSSIVVGENVLSLESVLASTVNFYPEIETTLREFEIAQGAALQAHGSFDTKIKATSENTPIGFYETYRSNFGIERPTFKGGSLFAGYRFGRGDFEPWYLERNTNELGELKLGANLALLRGREVDARRVSVWKANLKRQQVEPLVLNQLIQTLRDAEITYWNWVAAGQMFQLSQKLLVIAENRVKGIEQRIDAGDLAEITRTDNDRTILSREVKLLKAKAKLEQAAIKLSLFFRDHSGKPVIPDVNLVPQRVEPQTWDARQDPATLVANAIQCRPEVQLIGLEMRAVSLDIAKARNDFLPQLNAQVALSQDFGDPTSASAAASSSTQELFVFFDEKDEFQVDASLSLSQSLQRRKASGKVRALNGKLRQLHIKQAFLKEKIEAEVKQNFQLTAASSEQFEVAGRSLELARKLSSVARERYEDGDVDLFEIILREKQELDSAVAQIESMFSFHLNRANLNAAVGCIDSDDLGRLLQ